MIDITFPNICLFLGPPRSGKSVAIKWMTIKAFKEKHVCNAFLFSPTIFNRDYDYLDIPTDRKLEEYSDEVLEKILDKQENYIKQDKDRPLLLIFDDCLGTVAWKSKIFTRLITCYRHYKCTILISSQYAYLIPPCIRSCCTYQFLFHSKNKRHMDALYESVGSLFDNEKEFRLLLNANTKDYNALVIDTYNQSDDIEEVFHKFKAPHPDSMKDTVIKINCGNK